MKKIVALWAFSLALIVEGSCVLAQNPAVTSIHIADPSAHVWPGSDKLWVYVSHDQPGTNTHATMADYHVLSTTDMVNWTDYGSVLHVKNVSWAASHAWAIDAALLDSTYYLVYCMQEKGNGVFRTGLATSKYPQGPFTDIGYIKGVEWGQDPALFVDDDKQAYLYWGCGGSCFAAKLSKDFKSIIPETKVNLTPQLTDVFEGPWVHKYKGKYYLSYPALPGKKWPEHMYYAVADKPLGPYVCKGEYIGRFDGMAGTNHGSIVKYKNKWYAFHHGMKMSGNKSECRNMLVDCLSYNSDGTIKPIIPSAIGVAECGAPQGPTVTTILLEAENGTAAGGSIQGAKINNLRKGYSGSGYVDSFDHPNDCVTVMASVAKNSKYRLKVGYAAKTDQKHEILLNYIMLQNLAFPKSDGFTEADFGIVSLREGDNFLKFIRKSSGIEIDYIKLVQVIE